MACGSVTIMMDLVQVALGARAGHGTITDAEYFLVFVSLPRLLSESSH